MIVRLVTAVGFVSLCAWFVLLPASTRFHAAQQKVFIPPGAVAGSNVQYPLDTTVDGIVVFDVFLNAGGTIMNAEVVADIPPLTEAAESSLRSWKFTPASSEGANEPSQMLVAFVFRHAVKEWNPPVFNPVFGQERAGYTPPSILSATYAEYPASTIAAGATVVQVSVKGDGTISNLSVLGVMGGGVVPLVLKAARNWQFKAARLNGAPVRSKVAIAFVFSSRALNPF